MLNIGHSLLLSGTEVTSWNGMPGRLEYRDSDGVLQLRLEAPSLGDYEGKDGKTYSLVERLFVEAPSVFHEPTGPETVSVVDGQVVVDPSYTGPTVAEARTQVKERIQKVTHGLLQETDWLVIRDMEADGKEISAEQLQSRRTIRASASTLEAEVDLLDTLDALGAWEYPE